jgi:hypothetical protein
VVTLQVTKSDRVGLRCVVAKMTLNVNWFSSQDVAGKEIMVYNVKGVQKCEGINNLKHPLLDFSHLSSASIEYGCCEKVRWVLLEHQLRCHLLRSPQKLDDV